MINPFKSKKGLGRGLSSLIGDSEVNDEKSKINIDTIISKLKDQNVRIFDISTDDGDLEAVFLRLTKN